MKALVYTDTQQVVYREEPDPAPGSGEVLVKIEAVGICGSDMHAYLGHDARRIPPLILGHEACGVVVDGDQAGRRVVINPLITCGHCDPCLSGRANLCPQRDLIGMVRPGAFAEYVSIPRRNLVEVPDGMEPGRAALTEPAATALHAVTLAGRALHRPVDESNALVIGGGSVGLFAALALRNRGAAVWLAETNALRRETAAKTDALHVIDPGSEQVNDAGFDLVVDAVGGARTRRVSVNAVKPGGVIMHVGLMDNDDSLDVRTMTLQEITFIGTYTYSPVDFRTTVKKLHCGAFGKLDWPEQRPLAQGAAAFSDLLAGRCAAPKVILRP